MIRFEIAHECELYGTVGDDTIYIGLVPFETDDASDPCASFTFPLDFIVGQVSGRVETDDVLDRLEDPAVSSEVVATIVSLVTAFLVRRGARVDRASAIAIVEKDLATAAAEYSRELRGRLPGWVAGSSTWGDILLPRETAERWAQGWEALSSELPWDQLVDRVPREVVETIEEMLEGEHPYGIPPRLRYEWTSLFNTDDGTWPWLAGDLYQPPLAGVPDDVAGWIGDYFFEWTSTPDGDFLSWQDADELVERLTDLGYRSERNDRLVDMAMGPYGTGDVEPQDRDTDGSNLCPFCREGHILPILYGYPGAGSFDRARRGEAFLGGCVVRPGMPGYRCNRCGFDAV